MSLQGAQNSSSEEIEEVKSLEFPDDLENREFEIPQTQRELASQDEGEKSASPHLSENDDVEEEEEEENEADQSASHSESASPAESSDEEDEDEDEENDVAVETKDIPAAEINLLAPTVLEVAAAVSAPEEIKPVVEAKEEVIPEETTPRGKVAPVVVEPQVEEKADEAHDEPATPRGKVAPKIAAMIKALEGKIAETAVKSEDVSLLSGNVKALVTHYNNVRSIKDVRNSEEQPAAVVTAAVAAETDKSAARLSK